MRRTSTGLKLVHAEAVYKNYCKGDPPFKPQKGNFGKVSWFAGTGNAYVGGQIQSYALTVDVNMNEPRMLPKDYFIKFRNKYLEDHPKVDLSDTNTHRAFWIALGDVLQKEGLAEVWVPQGELSRQGSGTFIVANAGARMQIELAKPGDFRRDLEGQGVNVNQIEATVRGHEDTRAPTFNLKFNSIKSEVFRNNAAGCLTNLFGSRSLISLGIVRPVRGHMPGGRTARSEATRPSTSESYNQQGSRVRRQRLFHEPFPRRH
jgi:hypothetical protein